MIEAPTTTTTERELTVEEEAVRRGAEWLDENHPGWEARIDLTKLNLRNCTSCIVGQVYGFRDDANGVIFDYWQILRDNELGEQDYGFYSFGDDDSWGRLTEAWRDEITSRR